MDLTNQLRQLQKIDLELDKLEEDVKNLPQRERYSSLKWKLAAVKKKLQEKETELEDRKLKQNKIEGEIELLSDKIKREKKRLYSGKITDIKELSSLEKEVESLEVRKDKKETELLEHLDLIEDLGGEVDKLLEQEKTITNEAEKSKVEYENILLEMEEKKAHLEKEREACCQGQPPEALRKYDDLRKEKRGLAVVELKDGICQGCHLQLPAREVDRMVNLQLAASDSTDDKNNLWLCPHCKRIIAKVGI